MFKKSLNDKENISPSTPIINHGLSDKQTVVSTPPSQLELPPPVSIKLASQAITITSTSANTSIEQCQDLEELRHMLESLTDSPLQKTATNLVFGCGNVGSDVMLIGEAPGGDEDEKGQPFVGQSGQLLMDIFAAIGLKREDLYITNVIPYRPPANRPPSTQEIAFYTPYLRQHIRLVNPKVMVLLGASASKSLLDTKLSMNQLRGRFIPYPITSTQTIPCLVTYHPAYLLRSPGQKRQVWYDMCYLRHYLDTKNLSSWNLSSN